MPNSLFTQGRRAFLEGSIAWLTDNIRCALISSAYTPNATGNNFLTDVPLVTVVASSVVFTGKTSTSGIANAANITFNSVSGVNTIPYLILFKDTNVASTSTLIAQIDTASGLPVTSNGGNIGVNWDQVNGIFIL